jgi:gluconolactonase
VEHSSYPKRKRRNHMIFASDLSLPVSPIQLADSSWLVSEMGVDRGCVSHISADGQTKQIIFKTIQPNGLLLDKDGTIWVANVDPPSLVRITMDGRLMEVASAFDGRRVLFGNDLAYGPDGALYFTDSGILVSELLSPDKKSRRTDVQPDGRIYRIDLTTKQSKLLDSGMGFANGMAFGPRGDLYVTDTLTGIVYRYRWENGQVNQAREYFANVIDPEGERQGPLGPPGPDGIKVDSNGNCYVAVLGQSHICVLSPEGAVVKRIRTQGHLPTNVAFGPEGSWKLYISEAEFGVIELHESDADGFAFAQP